MPILRVYADTSVFGGVFDTEFVELSLAFFEQVKAGRFALVTSAVVQDEMALAPREVSAFFEELLSTATVIEVTSEALDLRDAYLRAGILTPVYSNDALHVALASVNQCALIVSWNFRHIVHFSKIPLYNAVNTIQGHGQIAIYSPREVIDYGEEDV
jgi:predicted nucleic acid-binding protein